MTKTCPNCGTDLLSGPIVACEQYVNRSVICNSPSGEIPLSAECCWKCGFTNVFLDPEKQKIRWFHQLAKGVWKGTHWSKIPVEYTKKSADLAEEAGIDTEFLISNMSEFIDWINDPFNLFQHAISKEFVSRHNIEKDYSGLIFKAEGIGEEMTIFLEDTRIVNKL